METFEEKIKQCSDKTLSELIVKGSLRLNDNQVETISFVFWLCFMAENDLNDILKTCWTEVSSKYSSETQRAALDDLKRKIASKKEIDMNNLEYFIEKIKIHEAVKGKNEFTKILWKLNDIRNNLSHNRIDKLEYNNESLYLREIKEKILINYFQAMSRDFNSSIDQ